MVVFAGIFRSLKNDHQIFNSIIFNVYAELFGNICMGISSPSIGQ